MARRHARPALLAVLTPAERAGILAHEIAHGANGDAARGRYLASLYH